MQTRLPEVFLRTSDGRRADRILRSCVHCGFCNATCPTYQVLGDELDGPRGRIYLIKELLEHGTGAATARTHLDRCLTCRACETTCPSGVAYGELLEMGRETLERDHPRPVGPRWLRFLLVHLVSRPRWFRVLVRLGHVFRWMLPQRLRVLVPAPPGRKRSPTGSTRSNEGAGRRAVLLNGCVQRVATPDTNTALRRLLAANGVSSVELGDERCCGALALHLGQTDAARADVRANVAVLYDPDREDCAILSTASGCGVTVKDYHRLAADDPVWADRARWVSERVVDAAEFVLNEELTLTRDPRYRRVAWQSPCTLQHGQAVRGAVESLLERAGYELVGVRDAHLCCGSAGSYAALQPVLSGILKARKLDALHAAKPDVIATANVGCQIHLAPDSKVPVVHWLELVSGVEGEGPNVR